MSSSETIRYPLLSEILQIKNLQLQATYTIRDLARVFGVSTRAIQNRIATGQLASRDLPGRAKCLPQDLEAFLVNSKKKAKLKNLLSSL